MCVPARGNFFLKEGVDTNFYKGRGGGIKKIVEGMIFRSSGGDENFSFYQCSSSIKVRPLSKFFFHTGLPSS